MIRPPQTAMKPRPSAPTATPQWDRGAGTILVLAIMGVIWLLAVTLMVVGALRTTRQRAHSAADSAALGAATRANAGSPNGCRIAATIAQHMHSQLTGCRLHDSGPTSAPASGWIAEVSVVTAFHGPPPIGMIRIPAQSRAGPSNPPDDQSALAHPARSPARPRATPAGPVSPDRVLRVQPAPCPGLPKPRPKR